MEGYIMSENKDRRRDGAKEVLLGKGNRVK